MILVAGQVLGKAQVAGGGVTVSDCGLQHSGFLLQNAEKVTAHGGLCNWKGPSNSLQGSLFFLRKHA